MWLNRFFGKPEEMNGAGRCPLYLRRWVVFKTRWGNGYIHQFLGNDWSKDLHDHPKRFISIGLWGSYLEITETGSRVWRAPWFRSFPAEHRHRIGYLGRCWTLVIVGKAVREWGWWHNGEWVQWWDYVFGSSSHIADKQRDC